jgi:hypothetical protein
MTGPRLVMRSEKMRWCGAVLGLVLGWALVGQGARAAGLGGACRSLPILPKNLVLGQVFPVNLPPYGSVCFAAHLIPDPFEYPPAQHVHGRWGPYIALSLYRHGRDVYDFTDPHTPPELWNTGIDKLVAVAFRRLPGSTTMDVIVLGRGHGAGTSVIYQPLVFMGSRTGFSLNYNLSLTLFERANISNMPSLLGAIDKIGVSVPPPRA